MEAILGGLFGIITFFSGGAINNPVYERMSCRHLGESMKVKTEYRVGRGCFNKATGEELKRR